MAKKMKFGLVERHHHQCACSQEKLEELTEENERIQNEKGALLQELKQVRMKSENAILQEQMKQERKRNSTQSESTEAELGPPPPPPDESCSSSSESEMPPGPPRSGYF